MIARTAVVLMLIAWIAALMEFGMFTMGNYFDPGLEYKGLIGQPTTPDAPSPRSKP